tara:strand:- start:34775 stop:35365 length:591 start_codon:yes stop_codon:yes gene_type:complete
MKEMWCLVMLVQKCTAIGSAEGREAGENSPVMMKRSIRQRMRSEAIKATMVPANRISIERAICWSRAMATAAALRLFIIFLRLRDRSYALFSAQQKYRQASVLVTSAVRLKTSKNLQLGGIDKVFCGFAGRNLLTPNPVKHIWDYFGKISNGDSQRILQLWVRLMTRETLFAGDSRSAKGRRFFTLVLPEGVVDRF